MYLPEQGFWGGENNPMRFRNLHTDREKNEDIQAFYKSVMNFKGD